MRHQGLAPLLAALALAACAHRPDPPPMVDIAAMQCTKAVNLEGAIALPLDSSGEKTETSVIDGQASCVEEAGGYRSLYRVFALPVMSAPSIITITAHPWDTTILAPRASFLDENGKAVRETTHLDFAFRGLDLSAMLRAHPDEKYLVVSADAEVLGHAFSRISGAVQSHAVAAGPVFFVAYTGTDTATSLVFAPAGRITVSIAPVPTK